MARDRLLIGVVLLVGSFALIKVGLMTAILGPVTGTVDFRTLWQELGWRPRVFVLACFVASAYGAGMILDSVVRMLKEK